MAWATAATIISDAAIRLGLVSSPISDPYAETDANIVRLCSALSQLGQDLLRDYQWTHLTEEETFSTANGDADYDLPDDFFRIVNQTAWNRSQGWPMIGPLSARSWQQRKSLLASVTINQEFRIWQNAFWINPTPTAIETIAYEYVSKLWVAATGGTEPTKDAPDTNTDELWFDRSLLTWGLQLYFKRISGFPSDGEQMGFEAALFRAQGGDGASPVLTIGGPCEDLDDPRIPDTGYGS